MTPTLPANNQQADSSRASLNSLPRKFLHPGEHFVTNQPMVLSTLLGSCVSVCLYDPVRHVMGMNHFLLASRHPGNAEPVLQSELGRYGLFAMEVLVNGLLKLGARREHLRAKAFGGANVLELPGNASASRFRIGTVNVEFVERFLEQDRIPLVAKDLGGHVGRQIHFHGADYSVFMRKIPKTKAADIVAEERAYLKNALKRQQERQQAEFF